MLRYYMEQAGFGFPVEDRVSAAVEYAVEHGYRHEILDLPKVDVGLEAYHAVAVGPRGGILTGIRRRDERDKLLGR